MEVIKGGKSGKPDETKMVSLDLSVLQTIIDISKTIETLRDKYYEVRTKSEEEIELYWIDFAKYWIENAAPFSTYVLDKLGITIEPKGKNGELTKEQILMINNTIEDYLYSEWNEEYIEMEEI